MAPEGSSPKASFGGREHCERTGALEGLGQPGSRERRSQRG